MFSKYLLSIDQLLLWALATKQLKFSDLLEFIFYWVIRKIKANKIFSAQLVVSAGVGFIIE